MEYPALAASRKPKTKKEINKEAIRIRYGKIVKRVPRKRLAVEIMNKAFKCDIHYLMDKTRTVFFPHEWKVRVCLSHLPAWIGLGRPSVCEQAQLHGAVLVIWSSSCRNWTHNVSL